MVPIPVEQLRREGKVLTVNQWLARIILLESFAGCPGVSRLFSFSPGV